MTGKLRSGWVVVSLVSLAVGCTESGIDLKSGGQAKGAIRILDGSGDAGQYVALALDKKDQLNLVCYNSKKKELYYQQHAGSGITTTVVDATCDQCPYATIQVDEKGEPHVAYYSTANQTLMYAYQKEGTWKREPIEWGTGSGMGLRLLFDRDGKLHALYYTGDGFLKHAWRVIRKPGEVLPSAPKRLRTKPGQDTASGKAGSGAESPLEEPEGVWGEEQVDKAHGSEKVQISFAVQPNGRLAASYLDWSAFSHQLKYAVQREDGSWASEVVTQTNNPGKSSALFFSETNDPQIIFREALKNRLSLAQLTAKNWKITPLFDEVYIMGLSVDPKSNLLIAYQRLRGSDPRKGELYLARRTNGVWTNYTIDDTPGSGSFLDVAVTTKSTPMIAYYEESSRRIKLFVGE
jgi:hypothetical protein